MPLPRRTDEELRRAFTGLVVESLAVRQDVARGTVRCAACADRADDAEGEDDTGTGTGTGPDLGVGDIVVVVLRNYEGFTWEIQDVFCNEHRVTRVADAVGIDADDQAVISAVLEAAGYHSPDGTYHPEALTLGDVGVLDYSPAEEGYADTVGPRSGADPAEDAGPGANPGTDGD
jgi:hypothetical protein